MLGEIWSIEAGEQKKMIEDINEISTKIYATVIDMQKKAMVDAIKSWACSQGCDYIMLIDEADLKEILVLGIEQYAIKNSTDVNSEMVVFSSSHEIQSWLKSESIRTGETISEIIQKSIEKEMIWRNV